MAIHCKMTIEDGVRSDLQRRKSDLPLFVRFIAAGKVAFTKATLSGTAEFNIDNPKAAEQLVIGQSYFFDITPPGVATEDPRGSFAKCEPESKRRLNYSPE